MIRNTTNTIQMDWYPDIPAGIEDFTYFVASREVEMFQGIRVGVAEDIGIFWCDVTYNDYKVPRFICLVDGAANAGMICATLNKAKALPSL